MQGVIFQIKSTFFHKTKLFIILDHFLNAIGLNRFLFFSISLLAIFYSCSYAPDGENFVEVEFIDSFEQTINLSLHSDDTIYVPVKTKFNYSAFGDYISETISEVYLDGEDFSGHNQYEKAITIDPKDFETGFYNLEVELSTKQAIGTLAHATNNTIYAKSSSRKWIIVIYKELPPPLSILKIDTFNHQLKVTWEKYDNFTFEEYRLERFNPKYYKKYFYFDDKDINEFIDSSFIWGEVWYKLTVKNSNGYSYGPESEKFLFDDSLDLNYEILPGNYMKIVWKKPILYNNFSHYELSGWENSLTHRVYDINDTTYLFPNPIPFGYEHYQGAQVVVQSKMEKDKMGEGTRVHAGEATEYLASGHSDYYNQFYAHNSRNIFLLDNDFNVVDQGLINEDTIYSSYDGHYNYVMVNRGIREYDLMNMQTGAEIIDLSVVFGTLATYPRSNVSISNNRLLSFTGKLGNMVIDMSDGSILYQKDYQNIPMISQDGSYLISNDSIMQFDGLSFNYIADFKPEQGYLGFSFSAKIPEVIHIVYPEKVDFYNILTQSIFNSIQLHKQTAIYQFDHSANLLLLIEPRYTGSSKKEIQIIDLEDGELKYIFPGSWSQYNYESGMRLVNNVVFSVEGYYLDLNTW